MGVSRRVSRAVIVGGPLDDVILPVTGGSLTVDLLGDVMRSGDVAIAGTPDWSPAQVGDALDPRTGTEVRVEQWDGAAWVSRGLYGISSAKVTRRASGLTVAVDVADRSLRVKQAGMPRRWVIPAGTSHATAVRGVLDLVAPWLPVALTDTTGTLGTDVVIEYAADAWKACLDLAGSAAMHLHIDVTGTCVWTPATLALAAEPRQVTWVTIDRGLDADQVINVVGAKWTEPRPESPPTGWVAATGIEEAIDDRSSTGVQTWMGRRIKTYDGDDTLLTSPTAAMQAAKVQLLQCMDVTYSGSGTVVPDPSLDVDQVVVLDGDRFRVTRLRIDLRGSATQVTLGVPPLDMATLIARASQPIRSYRTREIVTSTSPLRTRRASDAAGSEITVVPTAAVAGVSVGQVIEVQHSGLGARSGVAIVGEPAAPTPITDQVGIEYQTYVQDLGWTGWVRDGAVSGTTGASLRVEAIRARLYLK